MAGDDSCQTERPGRKKPHRSTAMRRKLKDVDPLKYQEYLMKQKERSKKQRDKIKKELSKRNPSSEVIEQKKQQLERQRKRQAKYMANRTLKDTPESIRSPNRSSSKSKCMTRKSTQEKRDYNRLMKQTSRAKMSSQKKNWAKKKDRERKQKKRQTQTQTCAADLSTIFIDKLHKVPEGKKALKGLAKEMKKDGYNQTFLSKKLGLNRRTIRKSTEDRLKKKTRINVKNIRQFYQRQDISRIVPQRHYATKDGPGFLLLTSVKDAHAKYLQENRDGQVSFSTFAALRPRNVRLLSKTHREYCMCSYCMNVRNKLMLLESSISSKGFSNENSLIDLLLCPKGSSERFHKPDCILGRCDSCSKNYRKILNERYSAIPKEKQLAWTRWERLNGKVELMTKVGNKVKMLDEFVNHDILAPCQGTTFIQHIFTAQWQQQQFTIIKNNLPENWCLQVMDFAKNRGIIYQDEANSAFFNNNQITIHPIVCYYKREKSDLIRDSCIIISEDPIHDFHAVQHFKGIVDDHIQQQLATVPTKMVVFSDGCAAQYKSKGPFADCSLEKKPTSRNFFGSEHGKSECDGETGILNRAVDQAIIGKKVVITNAEELYSYCNSHLSLDDHLSKRRYFLVRMGEISRERPSTNVRPIKKTRTFHSIENTSSPYTIKTRNLSCFCQRCIDGRSPCLNTEYVNEFETRILTLVEDRKEEQIEEKHRLTLDENRKEEQIEEKHRLTSDENRKEEQIEEKHRLTSDENRKEEATTKGTSVFIDMQACKTYEELQTLVFKHQNLPIITDQQDVTVFTHKRTVDKASMPLVPDQELTGLYPTLIYGDGNCLPRCGSLFAFGTEERHEEMRTRIVFELVRNRKKYTQMMSARNFAMYSDHFLGENLTPYTIDQLYKKEVLSIRKRGSYMGAWQMAALAEFLNRPLRSVYPVYGGQTVRKHLDTLFMPSVASHSAVHIMWTNIHGKDIPENQWRPNHFVSLMPLAPRLAFEETEPDPEVCQENSNLICDDMKFAESLDSTALLKDDLNMSSFLSDLEYDTLNFDDSADTMKGNLNLSSLISDLECGIMEGSESGGDPVKVVASSETSTSPQSTLSSQRLFKVLKMRNLVLMDYGSNIMKKTRRCGF